MDNNNLELGVADWRAEIGKVINSYSTESQITIMTDDHFGVPVQ